MRTTLNLDDALMRSVEKEASSSGRTMTDIIEQALRVALFSTDGSGRPFRLKVVTVAGARRAAVDLTDRDILYDLMEDPS